MRSRAPFQTLRSDAGAARLSGVGGRETCVPPRTPPRFSRLTREQRLFQEPSHRREHAARPPPPTARRYCSRPRTGRTGAHAALAPCPVVQAGSPTAATAAPLRRPLRSRDANAVLHHARLQEATHDPQKTFVGDPASQPRHQDVVVHPVEELFQVHVHHDRSALRHVFLRLPQSVVRSASGTEAVARVRKGGVQQGSSTCRIDCCTSRSTTVGMPNCRIPAFGPPGLGICTPRTGLGSYVPSRSDAVSSCRCAASQGSSSSTVIPSAPGRAPCSPLPVDGLGANSCHRKSFPSRTRLRSRPWSGPRSRPWSRLVLGRTPWMLATPRTLPLRFRRRRSRRGAPPPSAPRVGIGRVRLAVAPNPSSRLRLAPWQQRFGPSPLLRGMVGLPDVRCPDWLARHRRTKRTTTASG